MTAPNTITQGSHLPPVNQSARAARVGDVARTQPGDLLRYQAPSGNAERGTAYLKVGDDAWRRFATGRVSRTYENYADVSILRRLRGSNGHRYVWDVFAAEDVTSPGAEPWTVADRPVAEGELDRAPVGARMRTRDGYRTPPNTCIKLQSGLWQRDDGNTYEPYLFESAISHGNWLWAPAPWLNVGTPVRQADLGDAPVGARIRTRSGNGVHYTKRGDQLWIRTGQTSGRDDFLAGETRPMIDDTLWEWDEMQTPEVGTQQPGHLSVPSAETIASAPEGTRIVLLSQLPGDGSRADAVWVKRGDGEWALHSNGQDTSQRNSGTGLVGSAWRFWNPGQQSYPEVNAPRPLDSEVRDLTLDEFENLAPGSIVRDSMGSGGQVVLGQDGRWTRGNSLDLNVGLRSLVRRGDGSVRVDTLPRLRSADEMRLAGLGSAVIADNGVLHSKVEAGPDGQWARWRPDGTRGAQRGVSAFSVTQYRWVRLTEQVHVGHAVTEAHLAHLPVGSRIVYAVDRQWRDDLIHERQQGRTMQKQAEGEHGWRGVTDGWTRPPARQIANQEWFVQRIGLNGQIGNTCLPEGARLSTVQELSSLPMDAVLRYQDSTTYWIKTREGWSVCLEDGSPRYHYGNDREVGRHLADGITIYRLPVPPAVRELMDRAKEVIDRTVQEQGFSYVRDGGWWVLGVEPIPSNGSKIMWGSRFGLANGAVVAHSSGSRYGVWRIDEGKPSLVAGEDVAPSDDTEVTLVGSPAREVPHYRGPNHFLHELWERQREYRSRYRWCTAVEYALEQAGLEDPGDVPDEGDAPVAPVVGDSITAADTARFDLLPDGTIFTTNNGRMVVKGNGEARFVTDLRNVSTAEQLTVRSIPEQQEAGELPF